ncbi:MAG: hypothetical protein RR903_16540 [Edwardsiella sp. (in: enterobacteria)]
MENVALIEIVRQEIKDHVRSDDELKKQDALIQSVPGIGAVSSNLILSCGYGKNFLLQLNMIFIIVSFK